MSSKIVHYKHTMDKTCPLCKKQVKAIKLKRVESNIKGSNPPTTFQFLGCPECNNVFYHEEVNRFLKE